MNQMIREICVMSLLCSLACSIAPSTGGKNVLRIAAAVILLMLILKPLCGFDWEGYRSALAQSHELEQRLLSDSNEFTKRMNRAVIEEELRTYIMDKARKQGLSLSRLSVALRWEEQGYWIPVSVSGIVQGEAEALSRFQQLLETELGLTREDQLWEIG